MHLPFVGAASSVGERPLCSYLINSDGTFRSVVVDSIYAKVGKDVFQHGENDKSLFGSDNFNIAVAFPLLDAVVSHV